MQVIAANSIIAVAPIAEVVVVNPFGICFHSEFTLAWRWGPKNRNDLREDEIRMNIIYHKTHVMSKQNLLFPIKTINNLFITYFTKK